MTKASLLLACFAALSGIAAYGCAGDTSDGDLSATDQAFSGGGAEITLYENDNFQGRTLTLTSETDNFADIGFNDVTSSIIVRRGSWTLCQDAFFGGRCNTFTQGQYPNVHNLGMNDQYSSARPNGGGGGPTGLAWSSAGAINGKWCLQINEPADPDTWQDNYLCMDRDVGLRWSYSGQIGGMVCTSLNETAEPASHTWADNYLCAPRDFGLRWSSAGPIGGMRCTQIAEPADPDTWMDNYLCQP